MTAIRIFSRKIEEVDAGEDDEEAAKEGDCVHGIGRVEAAEEDEGGAEGEGRERDVVKRVDASFTLAAARDSHRDITTLTYSSRTG